MKPVHKVETEFTAPQMTLRYYEGEVRFHGHMVFSTENTLLPHSFRYPWSPPSHRELPDTIARLEGNNLFLIRDADDAPWLPPGDYVDLTHPYSGHFGHVVAQGLARVWGWERALESSSNAKALVQRRWNYAKAPEDNGFRILQLAGVSEDRIHWVDGPVRVESLIVPSLGLQYSSPIFIHPVVESTFCRMCERVIDEDPHADKKIFISRAPRPGRRECENAGQVEEIFRRHGFSIIFPERYSMQEQANFFGNAEVIAGFGGSGLYSLLYAENLEHLIILNSEAYSGRTEHLLALNRAKRIDYFWNPPVREEADYMTDWVFDVKRNGAGLERLLSDL